MATDPQKRREQQMATTGGNELEAVKSYFNTQVRRAAAVFLRVFLAATEAIAC